MRRSLSHAAVLAVSGTVLGASALLGAVLSVIARDDRAVFWILAALLVPTVGYARAWSRLMSAWSSSSEKERYYAIMPSGPYRLVRGLLGVWTPLTVAITIAALIWVIARLSDGASGWLGVAIPLILAAGIAALGGALSIGLSDRSPAITKFAFVTHIFDGEIERELKQVPPSGGSPDWNSYWLQRIECFRAHPPVDRTAEDCVEYIIAARSAAGLPPLRGVDSVSAPATGDGAPHSPTGTFLVNNVDIGVAGHSVVTVREGMLSADISAVDIPARAEGWALAPPRLYFHGVNLSDGAVNGRIVIDDARLDDTDIAFYLDAHLDVSGTLTVEDTRLHFSGEVVLAADDRWPVEVEFTSN